MSFPTFLTTRPSSSMTCGGHDRDSVAPRLHQSPISRPTVSHAPSFSTSSLGRRLSKDNHKTFSQRCVSPDSPTFRPHPSSPIALEEYASLPASVQRKYFSPAERLRIAQQAAAQRRHRQQSTDLSSGRTSYETCKTSPHSRSRSSHELTSTQMSSPMPSPSVKPSMQRLEASQKYISADQALWFLTLPNKVLRQQFSSQERIRLTERCEEILYHAAPDVTTSRSARTALADLSPNRASACPNAEPVSSRLPASIEVGHVVLPKMIKSDDRPPVHGFDTKSTEHSAFRDVTPDRKTELAGSRAHIATVTNFATASPSTPSFLASPSSPIEALPQLSRPRSRSMARTSALTPVALPPPTLAPVSRFSGVRQTHERAMSYSHFLSHPRPSPSMPELPNTSSGLPTFYHDSDTRTKLRRYVQSPEKFDEAIEFGFPTHDSGAEEKEMEITPGDVTRSSPNTDSDGTDDANSLDSRGPLTPRNSSHIPRGPRLRHTSSVDSDLVAVAASYSKHTTTGVRLSESQMPDMNEFASREMTVRMTLTRPELRHLVSNRHGKELRVGGHGPLKTEGKPLGALPVYDHVPQMPGITSPRENSSRKGLMRVLTSFRRH